MLLHEIHPFPAGRVTAPGLSYLRIIARHHCTPTFVGCPGSGHNRCAVVWRQTILPRRFRSRSSMPLSGSGEWNAGQVRAIGCAGCRFGDGRPRPGHAARSLEQRGWHDHVSVRRRGSPVNAAGRRVADRYRHRRASFAPRRERGSASASLSKHEHRHGVAPGPRRRSGDCRRGHRARRGRDRHDRGDPSQARPANARRDDRPRAAQCAVRGRRHSHGSRSAASVRNARDESRHHGLRASRSQGRWPARPLGQRNLGDRYGQSRVPPPAGRLRRRDGDRHRHRRGRPAQGRHRGRAGLHRGHERRQQKHHGGAGGAARLRGARGHLPHLRPGAGGHLPPPRTDDGLSDHHHLRDHPRPCHARGERRRTWCAEGPPSHVHHRRRRRQGRLLPCPTSSGGGARGPAHRAQPRSRHRDQRGSRRRRGRPGTAPRRGRRPRRAPLAPTSLSR